MTKEHFGQERKKGIVQDAFEQFKFKKSKIKMTTEEYNVLLGQIEKALIANIKMSKDIRNSVPVEVLLGDQP